MFDPLPTTRGLPKECCPMVRQNAFVLLDSSNNRSPLSRCVEVFKKYFCCCFITNADETELPGCLKDANESKINARVESAFGDLNEPTQAELLEVEDQVLNSPPVKVEGCLGVGDDSDVDEDHFEDIPGVQPDNRKSDEELRQMAEQYIELVDLQEDDKAKDLIQSIKNIDNKLQFYSHLLADYYKHCTKDGRTLEEECNFELRFKWTLGDAKVLLNEKDIDYRKTYDIILMLGVYSSVFNSSFDFQYFIEEKLFDKIKELYENTKNNIIEQEDIVVICKAYLQKYSEYNYILPHIYKLDLRKPEFLILEKRKLEKMFRVEIQD